MKKYSQIELDNGNKYVIIDMLDYDNKRYMLLTKIINNDIDIDKNFDICECDVENNYFKYVNNEEIYNSIKAIFLERLSNYSYSEFETVNFIKLKVIDIDGYNYKFETEDGKIVIKNIDFYADIKVEVNDYVYMLESTVLEENIFQYGPIINNKDEIIKIINGSKEYYLQRYYG